MWVCRLFCYSIANDLSKRNLWSVGESFYNSGNSAQIPMVLIPSASFAPVLIPVMQYYHDSHPNFS